MHTTNARAHTQIHAGKWQSLMPKREKKNKMIKSVIDKLHNHALYVKPPSVDCITLPKKTTKSRNRNPHEDLSVPTARLPPQSRVVIVAATTVGGGETRFSKSSSTNRHPCKRGHRSTAIEPPCSITPMPPATTAALARGRLDLARQHPTTLAIGTTSTTLYVKAGIRLSWGRYAGKRPSQASDGASRAQAVRSSRQRKTRVRKSSRRHRPP